MKSHRNIIVLVLVGLLWWFFFYVALQVTADTIGQLSDPANAVQAGKAYGKATTGVSMLAAIVLATLGTWKGVLPGTRPRLKPLSTDELVVLEKLDDLREQGILTDDEFAEQKARMLGENRE